MILDGKLLAMGSHDGTVFVYESEDEGKVYRRLDHSRLSETQLEVSIIFLQKLILNVMI